MPSRYVWPLLLALPLGALSCSTEEDKLSDGALCENPTQCKSGYCSSDGLCAASSCDCPGHSCAAQGSPSGDCEGARVCVVSTSIVEHVGQFFSGDSDNDGYCQLPCSAGCPEHFNCSGSFCVAEVGWADPIPTISWSGAARGSESGKNVSMTFPLEREQTVTLKATASSPAGTAIASYAWELVDDSGQSITSMGETVDLVIPASSSFRRAQLTVRDARQRAALAYVIFQACEGDGCT